MKRCLSMAVPKQWINQKTTEAGPALWAFVCCFCFCYCTTFQSGVLHYCKKLIRRKDAFCVNGTLTLGSLTQLVCSLPWLQYTVFYTNWQPGVSKYYWGKLVVGGITHLRRRITGCAIVFQRNKKTNLACFLIICECIYFVCFSTVKKMTYSKFFEWVPKCSVHAEHERSTGPLHCPENCFWTNYPFSLPEWIYVLQDPGDGLLLSTHFTGL